MAKLDISEYVKCRDCGELILKKDALQCDGLKFNSRIIPFGERRQCLCNKYICKDCATHIAGYDFCKKCFGGK